MSDRSIDWIKVLTFAAVMFLVGRSLSEGSWYKVCKDTNLERRERGD